VVSLLLALAARGADEPDAAEPEPPPENDPAYEVVVFGEVQVQQARDAVVERLEELGYDGRVVRRGDAVVYRHEAPWYGEVLLHDDGWMRVRRQPMHAEGRQMPWAKRNSPGAWAGCLIWPWLCVRTSGATYSHRKWLGRQSATVAELAPEVETYGDRVADLHTMRTIDDLPDRLAALWEQGRPLEDRAQHLGTAIARRRALFDFWASRTDTEWGDQVREAVEAFCRGVVQTSDHPFTPSELDRFEAESGRTFLRREPAGSARAEEAP
jgi:hypothetical protein